MSSKPTRLSRFLPLESFFMRLLSSSSLLLASLVVLSSLSALAAPVGNGREDSSSYAPAAALLAILLAQQHAPIPHSSDDLMAQPNNHLRTRNVVDKVTAPLAVPPELVKTIPDILHAVLDPLVGKDTPRAQGETFDQVKPLVPTVKTTWAEEVDKRGDDDASEDSRESSMWPFGHLSQPLLSLLPRGHAERQAGAGNEGAHVGSGRGGNTLCQCPP